MHPKVHEAIHQIDAALFNGDTFDQPEARAELHEYVRRWARELNKCPSICHSTEEPCRLDSGHVGAHEAEPSIPGTCGTVWVW